MDTKCWRSVSYTPKECQEMKLEEKYHEMS